MLVLTRKKGQAVRIGDTITVRLIEVKGSQVRLGIEAPANTRVYREEVYQRIKKEAGKKGKNE